MLQKNCLLKEDENQNNVSSVNTKASLLNDADNIPLIDVQSSTEGILSISNFTKFFLAVSNEISV